MGEWIPHFSEKIYNTLTSPAKRIFIRKGRRGGWTRGVMEYCGFRSGTERFKCLWGDTTAGNNRRYYRRYMQPFLEQAKKAGILKYKFSYQDSELQIKGYASPTSVIDFRSKQNPYNWEGEGYNLAALNESGIILDGENGEYIYNNAVEPMMIDHGGTILAFGAPKGFNYFKELYDKAEVEMLRGNPTYLAVAADMFDNPFFSDEIYRNAVEIVRGKPQWIIDQEYKGQFVAGGDDAFVVLPSVLLVDCCELYQELKAAGKLDEAKNYGVSQFAIDPSRGGEDATGFGFRYDVEYYGDTVHIVETEEHTLQIAIGTSDRLAMTFHNRMKEIHRGSGYNESHLKAINGNIDFVGMGQGPFEAVEKIYPGAKKFVGNSKSYIMDDTKTFWFKDKNAEIWWDFRQLAENKRIAINPENLALFQDLSARKFKITKQGTKDVIALESKEHDKKKLGRSPNQGDAAVMSTFEQKDIYAGMRNPRG